MFKHLEADDILGILATGPWIGGEKVIATKDKDLLQIPGLHINHADLDRGVHEVTVEQGDRWHLYQTLVGDQCDGYKGCPGIGPKKAERILNELGSSLEERWIGVVTVFEERGLTEADALLQARLARICRASDWDYENKVVKLWSPPTKQENNDADDDGN